MDMVIPNKDLDVKIIGGRRSKNRVERVWNRPVNLGILEKNLVRLEILSKS